MYKRFLVWLTLHAGISLLLQCLAPSATFYVSMDCIKHPNRVNCIDICCPFFVHFVTVMCHVSYPCTHVCLCAGVHVHVLLSANDWNDFSVYIHVSTAQYNKHNTMH